MALYGYNDWRYYQGAALQHAWGTSPKMKALEKAYNHEYYEEHKEEILAKLKEKRRNSYDYKDAESTDDYTTWDDQDKDTLVKTATDKGLTDSMSEMDVFADAEESLKNANLPPEVLENIRANNQAVKDNISKLFETVEDYVSKNADKLSDDDIRKMYNDASKQANLELKRVIDVGSAEGREYVGGSSGSKSSSSSKKKKASAASANQIATSAPQSQYGVRNSPIQQQLQRKKRGSSSYSANPNFSTGSSTYTSTRSNMPESATDRATIERERQRAQQRRR